MITQPTIRSESKAHLLPRIYLVEDEAELCRIVTSYLEKAGYEVTSFGDGNRALVALQERPPDLVILDIMLPGLDGIEILKSLRLKSDIPVLVVSAKRAEFDRILGLELGADDYLPKPFSARELVVRVKGLFRRVERQTRTERPPSETIDCGEVSLDLTRRMLGHRNSWVHLTVSEYSILERLMATPGQVFSRDQLLEQLGVSRGHDSRAIDMHVRNLRRKFEELGIIGQPLRSVRGLGYRFEE